MHKKDTELGSYLAAVFTSQNNPIYIFVITALLSFVVAVLSLRIEEEKQLEPEN